MLIGWLLHWAIKFYTYFIFISTTSLLLHSLNGSSKRIADFDTSNLNENFSDFNFFAFEGYQMHGCKFDFINE